MHTVNIESKIADVLLSSASDGEFFVVEMSCYSGEVKNVILVRSQDKFIQLDDPRNRWGVSAIGHWKGKPLSAGTRLTITLGAHKCE